MSRTLRRSLAPLALMGLIFWLSAQPDLDSGLGVWDTIARKCAHVALYAALTLLLSWALRPSIARPLPLAAAIALAYAISDEYHQGFVEGRDGRPLDVAIDAVGIAIASLLLRYDHQVRPRLEGEE
jgi:VanZ family protein